MAVEFTPVNKTNAWAKLTAHRQAPLPELKHAFLQDTKRTASLSIRTPMAYFDYSRQLVDRDTMGSLFKLAKERDLSGQIQAMFRGDKINVTEGRAVGHAALRSGSKFVVDGEDYAPKIETVLRQIEKFSAEVISGQRTGVTGNKIKNIVSIGIGGSYLGPEYLAVALEPNAYPGMKLRFVANVDGTDFAQKTKDLNPAETLFVIVSKTFTTAETMKNAQTAKEWMTAKLGKSPEVIRKHFIAVSTAAEKVKAFGIDPENMFGFWDFVGGRFSATSAVGGVPLSLYAEFDSFEKVLAGARWMDEHFLNAPLEQNIPVVMALLDIWNINFLNYVTRALLPYSQGLAKLPAHTQQVEMESNGKSVDRLGRPVEFSTGEVVFGEPGTNGQHSFYQLIHQGNVIIPCDFIGFLQPQHALGEYSAEQVTHHQELMTNFFAQPDALAFGKFDEKKQKFFPGNRPSSSLLLKKLDPFTAGMLLALTEHRAAAKGFIWGINSFDQFGVELGKVLGLRVRQVLLDAYRDPAHPFDLGNPSTNLMVQAMIQGKLPQ